MKYTAIIEWGGQSYNAYIPDLPGCVAAGNTPEEVIENLQDVARIFIEDMRERGEEVPVAQTRACEVTIEAA